MLQLQIRNVKDINAMTRAEVKTYQRHVCSTWYTVCGVDFKNVIFEILSYLEFYQFPSFNEKQILIRSDRFVVTVAK